MTSKPHVSVTFLDLSMNPDPGQCCLYQPLAEQVEYAVDVGTSGGIRQSVIEAELAMTAAHRDGVGTAGGSDGGGEGGGLGHSCKHMRLGFLLTIK